MKRSVLQEVKIKMQDKHTSPQHAQIWELLNEYADIRDELEDTLSSFQELRSELETALEDVSEELDGLACHLAECSSHLFRFRKTKPERTVV